MELKDKVAIITGASKNMGDTRFYHYRYFFK